MIDYIHTHQAEFWMTLGLVLLVIEVLVMGLTTLVLIFAGLGALATGLLMMAGLLPETWIAGLAGFGICSGVVSMLLWKPLRRLQSGSASQQKVSGDFTGLEFVLEQDVSRQKPGAYRYSGIDWRVELDGSCALDSLTEGQRVRVVEAGVGVFRVVAEE